MKRIQKPIEITVWAIFAVICYGILPFVGMIPLGNKFFYRGVWALPYNGSIFVLYDQNGEPFMLLIVISLSLCFFTVASAIWAWIGDNEGRIAFLGFATINVIWWMSLVIFSIAVAETKGELVIQSIPNLMIPPIWLGAIWYFFTRESMVAYYKREQTDIKDK